MQFLDWMQCITKPVGKKIRTVVTQGSNNNITQLTKYFSANVVHRIHCQKYHTPCLKWKKSDI